jgi:Zn-dependent peptidase ImmA (M78 family)
LKSIHAIRKQVAHILAEMEINAPQVPVEDVARHLGADVRFSPFEGELAGMLVRSTDRAVIGVNSRHHVNRQRFTIAHECGHLLLHAGDVHVDHDFRINRRDEISGLAVNAEEIEANRFAAELLMPYVMIRDDLMDHEIDAEDEEDIRKLARRYGVSLQAMSYRVANLLPHVG